MRKTDSDRTQQAEFLDAFFNHSLTPVVFLDRDFNFIRVNNAYAAACRREPEEFIGHNHFEFYPHAENQAIFAEVVRTRTPYCAVAKPFSFPDHQEWGVTYWDWTLAPSLDAQGEVQILIFSLQDVTERRRAERRDNFTRILLELFVRKSTRKKYLDAVVETMLEWTGCRCVGIRVINDQHVIPYESYRGFSHEFWELENWLSLEKDHCACTRVVRQTPEPQDLPVLTRAGSFRCDNAAAFVTSLSPEEQTHYRGNCVRAGFKSLAVIPIRYREQVLGAIHLADERENLVPLAAVEFIERMSFLIGEAVHRFSVEDELRRNNKELALRSNQLRTLAKELSQTEQRERRRLAQVLHDHLQQLLVGARFSLGLLRSQKDKNVQETVARVNQILEQCVKETRSLAVELCPPALYEGGLAAALRWLAQWMQEKHGLVVHVEAPESEEAVREEIRVLLFQIVRELLFNVAKHAGTNTAQVRMAAPDDSEITIMVEDNGVGFDPAAVKAAQGLASGFGLFSVRERLHLLNGRMEVHSQPGKGSRFVVSAPLRSSAG
jgi:PAS domain S-box-containing protein